MKYVLLAVVVLCVGYFGAMLSEGDHMERHIQKIESRY